MRFSDFIYPLLVLGVLFSTVSLCHADEITFEITVDKTRVSLGEDIQLNLSFYGTQNVPTPYFPDILGFDWRYLGPAKKISIINGKVSSSITHMYRLTAVREGKWKIPSFAIKFRGQTYTSEPVVIEVVRGLPGLAQGSQAGSEAGVIGGIEERAFLVMHVAKKQTYINEVIPVTIKLYANRLTLTDIQYPQIAHEGFSVDEFAKPRQYQDVLNGIGYDVIEFNTQIFALRPGELTLGPAELECNLVVKTKARSGRSPFSDDSFFGSGFFDDFFGRYENYPLNLKSVDIPITVMPLPQENKPADFSGALGDYRFDLSAEPKRVKVGDPITLKMTISGEGNFNTVKAPVLDFQDDFKIYDPQVSQDETSKTFEQVIIPKNHSVKEIPEISFNFFDTKSGSYKTLTRDPIAVDVKPLAKGEELKIFELGEEGKGIIRRKEIFGQDIIYIKDTPGKLRKTGKFLCQNKLFVIVQFIPLLVIIATLVFQKRKERLRSDVRYARSLRAPRRAKKNLQKVRRLLNPQESRQFFDTAFQTLREYLGDKFHLSTAGITSDVIEELKTYDVEQGVLNRIREFFAACDQARYAPSTITREQMLSTLQLLEEIIDNLERVKK